MISADQNLRLRLQVVCLHHRQVDIFYASTFLHQQYLEERYRNLLLMSTNNRALAVAIDRKVILFLNDQEAAYASVVEGSYDLEFALATHIRFLL